jgi:hypothetical protein
MLAEETSSSDNIRDDSKVVGDDANVDSWSGNRTEQTSCNWLMSYSPAQLRQHQLNDKSLRILITWLESNHLPDQQELQLSSPAVKRFWRFKGQLSMIQGVLHYSWEDPPVRRILLVIPDNLRTEVMQGCHDDPTGGHFGQEKTYLKVKRNYIWHNMTTDIKLYVTTCAVCSKQKRPTVKPKAALGSYQAGAPMERIHIDILGPLTKSERGNKYVLLLVDQFSKWVEIHPLPEQKAEIIAQTVVEQVFSRFGSPVQIHSDQGKNFDGNLFKSVCRLYRIAKTRTTPYRPCSNGQVERYNRILLQLIRCYIKGKQKSWDADLQLLAAAIRATPNRATGFTANMLFLGREIASPIDLVMGTSESGSSSTDPSEYVSYLRKTLQQVHDVSRDSLKAYQVHQKQVYDSKLCEKRYEPGDLVYKLHSGSKTGEHRKLKPVWMGPLLVTEVLGPALYRVKDRRGEYVLHHDKLKICVDRYVPMWMQRLRHQFLQLDTTLAYEEGEEELVDTGPEQLPVVSLENLFENQSESTGHEEEAVSTGETVNSTDAHLIPAAGADEPPLATVSLPSTVPHDHQAPAPHDAESVLTGDESSSVGADLFIRDDSDTCTEVACGENISSQQLNTSVKVPEFTTRVGRRTKRPKHFDGFV